MIRWHTYVVLLTLLAAGSHALGVSRFEVSNWRVEDGLPQNDVLAIAQTTDGFLWIGTGAGLVRFDGQSMMVVKVLRSSETGAKRVSHLAPGRDGGLWLVAGGRLQRLDAVGLQTFAEVPDLSADEFGGMGEDRAGNLLLLANSVGMLQINAAGEVSEIKLPSGHDAAAPTRLLVRDDGTCLLSNGNVLWRRDEEHWLGLKEFAQPVVGLFAGSAGRLHCRLAGGDLVTLQGGKIRARRLAGGLRAEPLLEDRFGNLWMKNERLWLERSGRSIPVMLPRVDGSPRIQSWMTDPNGETWIGTLRHGLFRVSQPAVQTFQLPEGDREVICLQDNRTGQMGVITRSGWFAEFADGDWDSTIFSGRLKSRVMLRDRDGREYRGFAGSGLWRRSYRTQYLRLEGCSLTEVSALFEDRSGRLWIGSDAQGVEVMDAERFHSLAHEGLSAASVTCFAEDNQGRVWIGTREGLFSSDGQDVRRYTDRDGFTGGEVRALHFDGRGNLWIGAGGGGLIRMKEGAFSAVTETQGLFDNVISQILDDGLGFLWLGGNRGLFRVSLEQLNHVADIGSGRLEGRLFQASEGLANEEFSSGAFPNCRRTGDGLLWFASVGGLVRVDPGLVVDPPASFPVHITGLAVDGEVMNQSHSGTGLLASGIPGGRTNAVRVVRVPPGTRRVEIHYTGVNLRDPTGMRFLTRLKGFDADWNDAGTRRLASFTGLRPGRYHFEVISLGRGEPSDGMPAAIALIMEPQWHETMTFRLALGLGLLAIGGGWWRIRRQRIRQVEQIRQRIARDLHDEVGANIGAINLLSGIAAEEQKGSPEGAGAVSEIRDVARETAQVLRDVVWFINPEFDTVGDLVAHMETLTRRMLVQQRVEFLAEVENAKLKLELPFRRSVFAIYKEAIHNILKHAEAAVVRVEIQTDRSRLRLRLLEDGKGYDPQPKSGGNGLKNMRERAAELGATMAIESGPGKGSKFTLEVPIR